jgi:tetratricopeptide (TPR) repeat protein
MGGAPPELRTFVPGFIQDLLGSPDMRSPPLVLAAVLLAAAAGLARADGKATALDLNDRALAAVDRGDLDEAVRLQEARKYLPADETLRKNLAAVHARRGLVAAKEDREEDALRDFRWAVSYDPDTAAYRVNLALSLIEAKDLDEARKQLETVLATEPRNPDALEHYGRLLYRANDLPGAIRAWKSVLEVSPDREGVRRALAKAVREQQVEDGMQRDEGAHFAVTFDGESNEDVARRVQELLEDAYTTVGYELGHYPRERVQVILYTNEQFHAATEAKSWVGGLYDGKIRLPVRGLSGSEDSLRRTAVHEYVHVVVRDLAPRCPVWLNEGLAQLYEGKPLALSDRIAAGADRDGRLLDATDLARPFVAIREPDKAAIAYAEAHSLTAWLSRTVGGSSFADFLQAMKAGKSADVAFQLAFRRSVEEAWSQWLEDLRSRTVRPDR